MRENWQFFCCLPVYESAVSRALGLLFHASAFLPLPVAAWDALWIVPAPSYQERQLAYLHLYSLDIILIYNPITEQMEEFLVILDLPVWVDYSEYMTSEEANCASGCSFRKLW